MLLFTLMYFAFGYMMNASVYLIISKVNGALDSTTDPAADSVLCLLRLENGTRDY